MTPNEIHRLKRFLDRWMWTWVLGVVLFLVGVFASAVVATSSDGTIDGGKFESQWLYVILLAFLPTVIAVGNHLLFRGRERVGLTPEARRERMHRLERERDAARQQVRDRDRTIDGLERDLRVGKYREIEA